MCAVCKSCIIVLRIREIYDMRMIKYVYVRIFSHNELYQYDIDLVKLLIYQYK